MELSIRSHHSHRRHQPYANEKSRRPREAVSFDEYDETYASDDLYGEPLSFDEKQGQLSLYKPIKPEYLTLHNHYYNIDKFSSLPRSFNYSTYSTYGENIETKLNKCYTDSYYNNPGRTNDNIQTSKYCEVRNERYVRNDRQIECSEKRRHPSGNSDRRHYYRNTRSEVRSFKVGREGSETRMVGTKTVTVGAENRLKQVNVCRPLRLAAKSERQARYWTTDTVTGRKLDNRPGKTEGETKKNVTFSEVSGCEERKTIIHDPVSGTKILPVRELEVSLDQMIQNGYFERHNIRIQRNDVCKILDGVECGKVIPNGHCESGKGLLNGGYASDLKGCNRDAKRSPYPQHVENRGDRPKHLSQVVAALAVSLAPFSAGLSKGYSSPAIASMQGHGPAPRNTSGHEFSVSDQEASWVASLSLLGALFGGLVGGAAMRHGRRRVLLLAAPPFSLSWLLTVLASSVEVMFFTSFMAGFCCSLVTMVAQVYISEISVPDIRGCLSAVLKIVGHLGVLMSFIVGAYLDWQQLAMFISVAPIILFCTVIYIPETPSYLVLYGRDEEAYKSLVWLRGPGSDVIQELATIRTNVLASKNFSNRQRGLSGRNLLSALMVNRLLGPISITCGLMMFQRFSGAHAFSFYAVPIFRKTFGGMNPHGAAIAVSFVQLLASCLSGILIDTVGRLPLLIASSVFMSMALAGFGSYAYYEEVHRNQRIQIVVSHQALGQNDWIPLLCVLVFTIAFALGMSPISWLLIGELFPLEYRGLGSATATAFSYFCAFIGVKTFIDFQQTLGLHGAFWLYASISVGGLCFVVCCVPETKGKDLDEMDPKYVQSLSLKR